ncbi:hypothetical protein CEXT_539111 [Caerostris extrusa]|uniref:Uncharacterized protein n=1 Tax=Caerostris extrusa TaxID=172846 RepID=A0AAV4PAL6_CAEEX|nr:hypothetical protein CEXT_539111 [Caerostris extrusa]
MPSRDLRLIFRLMEGRKAHMKFMVHLWTRESSAQEELVLITRLMHKTISLEYSEKNKSDDKVTGQTTHLVCEKQRYEGETETGLDSSLSCSWDIWFIW